MRGGKKLKFLLLFYPYRDWAVMMIKFLVIEHCNLRDVLKLEEGAHVIRWCKRLVWLTSYLLLEAT